jgi:hypothetical protein
MATIRKEIHAALSPHDAWDAVRDFGNLHQRLVAGFVTNARMEGADRIATFFTGLELRERLVTLDDDARRLAWSIVDGPYSHHNGSLEVFADGEGTRLVWTTDLLPDEAADRTAEMMEAGARAMKRTLEGGA